MRVRPSPIIWLGNKAADPANKIPAHYCQLVAVRRAARRGYRAGGSMPIFIPPRSAPRADGHYQINTATWLPAGP